MAADLLLLAGLAWGWNPIGADWTWQDAPNEEPVYVHRDGFADPDGAEAAIRAAADAWNRQTEAAYAWDVAGDTFQAQTVRDGLGVVHKGGHIGGAVLAQSEVYIAGTDVEECDITFYASNAFGSITWSTDPDGAAPDAFDLERMATHELGHCLGLHHTSEPAAIRWPAQGYGTGVGERLLHPDDIAGAEALYGVREGPLLVKTSVVLDDGGDGVFQPGETVDVWVELSNVGTETALSVVGNLEGAAAPVDWGTLLPGDTVAAPAPFQVVIDAACTVDHVVSLGLSLADDGGDTWQRTVAVRVDCGVPPGADLSVVATLVDDDQVGASAGNGNGVLEIGERASLSFEIANSGTVASPPLLVDLDPQVGWLTSSQPRTLSSVAAGGTGEVGAFTVFVLPSCADPPAELLLLAGYGSGDTGSMQATVDAVCAYPAEPELVLAGWWVDGDVETGATFDLRVEVQNTGDAPAEASGTLVTGAVLQAGTAAWPEIAAGASEAAAFEVTVDPLCSVDTAVALAVELETPVGYDFDLDLGPLDVACDLDVDGDGFPASVDCDDGDGDIWPGAPELCDAADRDCDGSPDAGALDAEAYFEDADADGFGAGAAVYACDQPEGHVKADGDCDDGDGDIWPGAPEVCDGVDQDCDEVPDDSPVDADTWYGDGDGDGFGAGAPVEACQAPAGYVDVDGDCDDADASAWPGAPESCDGPDLDCDGTRPAACGPDPEDPEPEGCGCASAPGPGWVFLLALAAIRRRR